MGKDAQIVVTGGAGFVGSGVIKLLNERGYRNLVVVDNLGHTEKWKNLVGKHFSALLHKNDLFSWLAGRAGEIDAIIHLGACSNTLETDANYLLENNYRYSVRLCEWALTRGALRSPCRFIYASSASTYGAGEQGFSDAHEAIDTLAPLNMYGYSKQLFDLWAKQQGVLSQIVGLKYFNVFGPNEYHKGRMASAILKMLADVTKEGVVRLFRSDHPDYADGEQRRDFVYVKDAACLTLEFLSNPACGIYNVGSGEASSWNRLARAVFSAVEKAPCIDYIALPEDLKGKYQHFTQADTKKIAQALGKASLTTSLEEAVRDYVRTYLLSQKRW